MAVDIIEVSALNKYVKSLLESDPVLTDIAIRGEISNFTKHYKTGHCYFSLKDSASSVKAVMFKRESEYLSFKPENGMKVVVRCRISLYERDGTFQIYVDNMFMDGVGAARLAFDKLKNKLNEEGLFDPEHKKPIPPYPERIGLVTSKTGAALQDILKVARLRCPLAKFVLSPAPVQGDAADYICEAVKKLDDNNLADVIIIARGGGSEEDLWVFNDEKIARCVFSCKTPVISAIGHEIDFSILDFTADYRAATPTAAAELVLPDLYSNYEYMKSIALNILKTVHNKLDSCYNVLDSGTIMQSIHNKYKGSLSRFEANIRLASAVNPYEVLARGYSIVKAKGKNVSSVSQLSLNESLEVILADGKVSATVNAIEKQQEGN